jgi:DNA-binding transcriptional LysR family regulator
MVENVQQSGVTQLKANRYRLLLEISEDTRISTAADILSATQAAVSRMLANLECNVGVQPCSRQPEGLSLTR